MANTNTLRTLYGSANSKTVVRSIHIVSDGSEETDLVIYDNSTLINDVSVGSVEKIWVSGSACLLRLEWDQTTDAPVISLDPSQGSNHYDFTSFGGITNPNGSGATGDLLLTTASLDSGDEVTLIVQIRQG